jgi:toxin ParE1/3/4
MRVELSRQARADLLLIGDWIAQENPVRAVSFVDELQSACLNLSDFPARYPLYKATADGPMRRKVYGNYLIFYVVGQNTVTVARILHGAQNYSDLF